jgi:hypothetical protein
MSGSSDQWKLISANSPRTVTLDRIAEVVSELDVRRLVRSTSRKRNDVVDRRSLRVWNDLVPRDRLVA